MPEDPEIRLMDAEEEVYSPERRQSGPDKKKIGVIAAVGVAVLAVLGGIYLMLGSGGVSKEEARLMQTKLSAMEQKIVALEKQQAALQARLPAEGAEAALAGKIDTLAQRVETLEKRPVAAAAEKPKAAVKEKKEKPAVSAGRKTHTVQKGETVFGISKKYGMKPAELRKLNNLGEDDPVRPGQKLVVGK
ncbi:MAG: LysM domain-containing protein [Pseudomonadota bacterium]|jgi:LysM repeat protein|nr:LysM peptidoglycan-binding domain-containing protein [Syntrophaceae bacterium]MDI9555499.1 LysM domain-containing protein [Pseudomonadota bacterium]NLX32417.1 LysM peptidoglycan-binding domain-containing protein [Deltaproteobacteria bacterium]HNU85067.1 LysM domain-containing protein [Syntrophales bacterium]HNZ34679.1 LysM domain-containing protein [Syntrophales bacterium]